MSFKPVTSDQATRNIHNGVILCMNAVSAAYKFGDQKVFHNITKLVDATKGVGKATTAAYHVKSYHMIYNAFKHVKTKELENIVRHPDLSFKEKVLQMGKHVTENFSHEATVSGLMKGAKIGAITAVGLTVGLMAPGAVAAAAFTTGVLAQWYLGGEAGHAMEVKMANGIDQGLSKAKQTVQKMYRAMRGANPEVAMINEIAGKMEHAAQEHGHHAHKTFKEEFAHDVKSIASFIMNPVSATKEGIDAVRRNDDVRALRQMISGVSRECKKACTAFVSDVKIAAVNTKALSRFMAPKAEVVPLMVEAKNSRNIFKNKKPESPNL